MPNYIQRDTNSVIQGSALDILNSYGANNILPPLEEEREEPNDLLNGGTVSQINSSKAPHKEMIRAILKMKPKDIHIIKRAAKYFLDNPQELKSNIDEVSLEDISQTKNSNDLADMLESDFEITQGGEDLDNGSLLYDLGRLIENVPSIQKIINI